jgi:hypothetical protein
MSTVVGMKIGKLADIGSWFEMQARITAIGQNHSACNAAIASLRFAGQSQECIIAWALANRRYGVRRTAKASPSSHP